jgi:hypothetical protein
MFLNPNEMVNFVDFWIIHMHQGNKLGVPNLVYTIHIPLVVRKQLLGGTQKHFKSKLNLTLYKQQISQLKEKQT